MAALSAADFKPCPHCGRELHKWMRNQHVRACPLRPEIADAMRAALTGPDGYAVSSRQYADQTQGSGLPGNGALKAAFGPWAGVCAHFGLVAHDYTEDVQCPHCQRLYTMHHIRRHVRLCAERPEIAAALREVLTGPDGCMVSRNEYDAMRTPDLLTGSRLAEHYGGWAGVAARFGLTMRTAEVVRDRRYAALSDWRRGYVREWTHTPQEDPLLVGAVRVREDYGEGDGLAYYGERRLGGGGTAYMLR